jgi:hypothetical protein
MSPLQPAIISSIAVSVGSKKFRFLVQAIAIPAFFMRQFLYGLKPLGIPAVSMLGPVVRKGDVVTDFELPDETGAPRRLSGLLADGPVVLFFYPAAMSLGCTVESCHFRDLIGEFKAVGAQPVGISADRVERQRHFADFLFCVCGATRPTAPGMDPGIFAIWKHRDCVRCFDSKLEAVRNSHYPFRQQTDEPQPDSKSIIPAVGIVSVGHPFGVVAAVHRPICPADSGTAPRRQRGRRRWQAGRDRTATVPRRATA